MRRAAVSVSVVLVVIVAAAWLARAVASPAAQGLYPTDASYRAAFRERCRQVREETARQVWAPGEDSRKRIYLGVVKMATGTDAETGLRYLREAVEDPEPVWQSFETYAFMDAVLRLGSKIPHALVERIRARLAASFTADFGFTDNHHLQFRTARYLYGQTWPDGPRFADGSAPLEGMDEASDWILGWIGETAGRGLYEYDSPNYHHLYLLCLATLHEFARDPGLKRKAWMMEHLLLAEWASEYLHGVWVGAHSREKYNQVTHTSRHPGAATPFGPLFFGGAPVQVDLPEAFYTPLGALQAFEALPLIGRMATDRRRPYVLRELKPPRRGPAIINGQPTWKYTYVTPGFALGSSWGDLTDVENHRWDLTWVSPRDGATCFFINPSYSAQQLARYYYDTTVDRVLDEILRQRPYYGDPNKWVEGSPHEDVFQHENVVIAIYDIPADSERQHVNGFFPHAIEERREERGWILCRAGDTYFAAWTASPGAWQPDEGHDRLTLRRARTAVVLEAVPASEYSSFGAFCRRVTSRTPTFDAATLTVSLRSTRGRRLQFTHRGRRVVDGTAVRLDDWPLFEGPWINARVGTRVITLTAGGSRVVLDFNE